MSALTWKFKVLALFSRLVAKPAETLPPAQARAQMRDAMSGPAFINGLAPALASVRDDVVAGVRVRRYLPVAAEPGLLVYFHGGGWVYGDLDTHHIVVAQLAAATRREVVAVDYRLAPEHRYPAALDDAVAVIRALAGPRMVLAGDSAGGNLVAAAANQRVAPIAAQVLVYPATDCVEERPSCAEFARGHVLTLEALRYFRREYVPDAAMRAEPGCSPIRAPSLEGVPPAYLLLAGCDVLRDEGREYAARLVSAGVETHVDEVPGVIHGFFGLQGLGEARSALDRIVAWLEPRW
ncbi:MAG TPA: alpha/beta hydrolase [Propionicimonas sp.]|jgi:acetyl esterase